MTAAVVLGVLGPLAVAAVSWMAAERTWQRAPARLTGVMIAAFAGKVVFFAAYVACVVKVLAVPPLPFAVSFTTAFVAAHLVEALALRRLFSASAAQPRGRDTR